MEQPGSAWVTRTFTDNGDGTLTDHLTGFAGHGDWRVPNQSELFSLVNLGELDPATYPALNDGCVDGCEVTTCSRTQSGYHWSSSTYDSETSGAWFVGFVGGYTGAGGKTNGYSVRAVRGDL